MEPWRPCHDVAGNAQQEIAGEEQDDPAAAREAGESMGRARVESAGQIAARPGAHGELAVVADAVGRSGLAQASTVGVEARLSCASVPGGRVDGSVPVEAHACDRAETSRSSHVVQRRRPTEATDRLASLRRDVRDAELVLALRAFAVAKAGCVERAREMD